jgi:hypothetical protein
MLPTLWICLTLAAAAPPGVVIDHQPAAIGQYIGSPSIVILPGGEYVASHDLFGLKSGQTTSAVTLVFRSTDRGQSWQKTAEFDVVMPCSSSGIVRASGSPKTSAARSKFTRCLLKWALALTVSHSTSYRKATIDGVSS